MTLPLLFFGERDTANIVQADVAGQNDNGTLFSCLAESNPHAPAGEDGEASFEKLWLSVSWDGGPVTLTLTPIVDGTEGVPYPSADGVFILQQTVTLPAVTRRTTQVFEVPVVAVYREGGVERSRARPRGTWFRARIEWSSAYAVLIEKWDFGGEVLRESKKPASVT